MAALTLQLRWRRFALQLPRPLHTSRQRLSIRQGWLLQLITADGSVGWGEAAPLAADAELESSMAAIAAAIEALGPSPNRRHLEAGLAQQRWPASLAFALGAALAEADGLIGAAAGGWLPAPEAAVLLPAGEAALPALTAALVAAADGPGPVFKWKVAVHDDAAERQLLEQLLLQLPAAARLRLDANGRWPRATAWAWADRLAAEPRLQWLEQPLAPDDHAGLEALARRVPVALDESLVARPALRGSWSGWQVRRPSQEGDPRPLLAALQTGCGQVVLSTAFETGIGRRWVHHLAALQAQGPTPVAPGLALAWQPQGAWANSEPQVVWEAAA